MSSPNAANEEKPRQHRLLIFSLPPQTRRRPRSFFSLFEAMRRRRGDVAEASPRLRWEKKGKRCREKKRG
ncbi:hypothetical protein BHE74_00027795 [Ensete ventricosum]|nr:hypothetical protein BHE74_00027795 [Ensete ventricosum]